MRRQPEKREEHLTHVAATSCNYLEFPSRKVLPKPLLCHFKTFTLRMSHLPGERGISLHDYDLPPNRNLPWRLCSNYTQAFFLPILYLHEVETKHGNLMKQLTLLQKAFWSWAPHSCCLAPEGRSPRAERGAGCLLLLCSPSFPTHRKLTLAPVLQKLLQLYLMEHAKSKYRNGYMTRATASTETCAFHTLSKTLDTDGLPESHAEHTFFRISYGEEIRPPGSLLWAIPTRSLYFPFSSSF